MRLIQYELTRCDTPKSNVKINDYHYTIYQLAWFITELTFKYPVLFMVYKTELVSLGYRHGCQLRLGMQQSCD